MSPQTRAELHRLAAEFKADINAAAEKATRLEGWTLKPAAGDEVFIPASLLHHYYTAIESALARAVRTFEGTVPSGADSHTRLLHLSTLEIPAVRPGILQREDWEPLHELLDFRHLFRHAYGAALRPERVQQLATLAVGTWPSVRARLESFLRHIEACAAAE